jgi:hypothetical protein
VTSQDHAISSFLLIKLFKLALSQSDIYARVLTSHNPILAKL